MRLTLTCLVAALVVAGCGGGSPDRLTFHDDFDGSSLDRSRWGMGWEDSFSRPTHFLDEQVEVADGRLRIAAEATGTPSGRPYAGGLVQTREAFGQRYGTFEARMKVPRGRGLWSAFWLMPVSGEWPPEIDVMETVGGSPRSVYQTNHWSDESGAHQTKQCIHEASADLAGEYHVYGIVWSPGSLVWKVDGEETCRADANVPEAEMYLVLDLAVGSPEGDAGDWVGMPDESTRLPARLEVDWVRAYSGA